MLCTFSDKKLSLPPESSGLRKLTQKRHIQILAQSLIYIMSNCSTTQKKTLFYPSKFDSQLEVANILTSSYLLVLSMIRKSYTPALRRKNVVRQSQYCAPKMAYFRTKLSLSGQNLQLSDKILKILARKTITYEKFYVRFAFF